MDGAPTARSDRLRSDDAGGGAEAEEEKEKHWAESIVGRYEATEGPWNGRPAFRCRKWSSTRASELEVTLFYASEPVHSAGWWISHGWEGPSHTLRCAENIEIPPERGGQTPMGLQRPPASRSPSMRAAVR